MGRSPNNKKTNPNGRYEAFASRERTREENGNKNLATVQKNIRKEHNWDDGDNWRYSWKKKNRLGCYRRSEYWAKRKERNRSTIDGILERIGWTKSDTNCPGEKETEGTD